MSLECWLCWDGEGTPSQKKNDNMLVCGVCYRSFVQESSAALLNGRVISLPDWLKEKIPLQIEKLKPLKEKAVKEWEDLRERIFQESLAQLKSVTGKLIDRTVFNDALGRLMQEKWKETGGNQLYWKMKSLEKAIKALALLEENLKNKG
ncbi:MAG: hypothetical protein ACPLZH_01780 [Minisyncoccales bacterium]